MSEEQEINDTENTEIVMSGKVPYLAIMGSILRSSKNQKEYFDIVEGMAEKDEHWEKMYNELEDDLSHKNNSYFSFDKNSDCLDLAVSCLVMAGSNTFSNTKKDVLITPTRVYVTQFILEQVWKGKDRKFEPSKTLTREGFKDNTVSLSKAATSVIPVDEEIALLHGEFCRDTWHIINAIISPVNIPKSGFRKGNGDDTVYGLMLMFGESYEALAMLADTKDTAWDKHVAKDFASILKSFVKKERGEEGKDEKDNIVPGDKDK